MRPNYYDDFRSHVVTALGGIEMANEFFHLHPYMTRAMIQAAEYHYHKGGPGSAKSGAEIWMRTQVRDRLERDRRMAPRL
jgi:hypothetical protein